MSLNKKMGEEKEEEDEGIEGISGERKAPKAQGEREMRRGEKRGEGGESWTSRQSWIDCLKGRQQQEEEEEEEGRAYYYTTTTTHKLSPSCCGGVEEGRGEKGKRKWKRRGGWQLVSSVPTLPRSRKALSYPKSEKEGGGGFKGGGGRVRRGGALRVGGRDTEDEGCC